MKSGKKEMKIEVYESLSKRKQKFLVTGPFEIEADCDKFGKYAMHFFRCSAYHLRIVTGYLYMGGLYFEQPSKKGFKRVNVAYYQKAV